MKFIEMIIYKYSYEFKDEIHTFEQEPVFYGVKYNKKTTLSELFKKYKVKHVNTSHAFKLSSLIWESSKRIPYLISKDKNKIKWNINLKDAKVVDYMHTHQLKKRIFFETFIEDPDDCEFQSIFEQWDTIYTILKKYALGKGNSIKFRKTFNKLSDQYIKDEITPYQFLDLLFSEKRWHYHKFAKLAGIKKKNAKILLPICGYKKKKSKRIFIKTEKATEVIAKIKKANRLKQ